MSDKMKRFFNKMCESLFMLVINLFTTDVAVTSLESIPAVLASDGCELHQGDYTVNLRISSM